MWEKIHEQLLKQTEGLGAIAIWVLIITSCRALLHPSSRGFFITIVRLILCLPVGAAAGGVALEFGYGEITAIVFASGVAIVFENSSVIVKKHGDKAGVWLDIFVKKLIDKWTK